MISMKNSKCPVLYSHALIHEANLVFCQMLNKCFPYVIKTFCMMKLYHSKCLLSGLCYLKPIVLSSLGAVCIFVFSFIIEFTIKINSCYIDWTL
jgi:hypothetical protein